MNYLKVKLRFLSLLIILAVSIFMTSCEQERFITDGDDLSNPVLDQQFKGYEIIEIDNNEVWNTIENQIDGEVNLEMRKASSNAVLANWSFNMKRIQVEADDFTMNLIGEGGEITQVEMPELHVLIGQLNEDAGKVFMGITKENLRAEVIEGEVTYMIEPLSDYILDAKPNEYVKYNVADIITTEEHTCGFDESQMKIEIDETDIPDNIEERLPNCLKVEVMWVGDYDLYRYKFNSNFNNAAMWMKWRIIHGSQRYYFHNDLRVNLILKKGWLYTSNTTIANSNNDATFINQWKNFATNNAYWIRRGDANILFTGKNTNALGLAWIRTICNSSWSYAFVEHQSNSNLSINLTAHEIAHILGAYHSSSGFMTPTLSSSTLPNMSTQTRNEINGWIWNNSSCLGYWGCHWY